MTDVTPSEPAHPLTFSLITALGRRDVPSYRVLIVGAGSGRSVPPLVRSGFVVDALEESPARVEELSRRFAGDSKVRVALGDYDRPDVIGATYDGALATHAYMHGRRARVAAGLRALAATLAPNGAAAVTLGSTADPRCGRGAEEESGVWTPTSGAELGIPHLFLDEEDARALLAPHFDIVELRERSSGALVGRWAHGDLPEDATAHWFAVLRRRSA